MNNEFLTPIKINNIEIPTKIFFAPINTGLAIDGNPTDKLVDFQIQRSGKLIGISYIGNVAIGKEYVTNNRNTYFTNKVDKWKNICEIIKKNGTIPAIQLGCRYSKIVPITEKFSKSKDQYIKCAIDELNSISKEEIDEIINKYVDNAMIAYELGYPIIQIHAAHGYFLSLLLSDTFNYRKDEYGRRTRALTKIVEKIKSKNHNIIIDVRLSIIEGIKSEIEEFKYKEHIMKDIVNSGVDIISLSNGIYNIDKRLIYPDIRMNEVYINQGIYFANKYPEVIWNTCGNIYNFKKLQKINLKNLAYSIGRSLLADPYMILKYVNGKEETIQHCIGCNRCHYYSNGDNHIFSCIN